MTGSDRKPNKKRKAYNEEQKKYPDLHRRRTLHPRSFSELVAGRARTDVSWHAYERRILVWQHAGSRARGHRELECDHRSQDAGSGLAQRLLRRRPSPGVRLQRVDAGLVRERALRVLGVWGRRDSDA